MNNYNEEYGDKRLRYIAEDVRQSVIRYSHTRCYLLDEQQIEQKN